VEPQGPLDSKESKFTLQTEYPKKIFNQIQNTDSFERRYQEKKIISSSKSGENHVLSPKLDPQSRAVSFSIQFYQ
jgi:hypothetical protein